MPTGRLGDIIWTSSGWIKTVLDDPNVIISYSLIQSKWLRRDHPGGCFLRVHASDL